jgi:hypothetical protein
VRKPISHNIQGRGEETSNGILATRSNLASSALNRGARLYDHLELICLLD